MLTAKLILLYLLQSSQVTSLGIDPNTINADEAMCMAQVVYYEARNEDIRGQYAVAHATLNRVNDPRFPKTVCAVVKQAKVTSTNQKIQCAFSWYCDSEAGNVPVRDKNGKPIQVNIEQFEVASLVAITALAGETDDNTNGATHFHNPYTSHPSWSKTLIKTVKIGNHAFYKMQPPKPVVKPEDESLMVASQ
jgi:spore germination cell wall hydrolase CwlJ-like protein